MIEQRDILVLLANLSVVIAGFSGIVVAYVRKQGKEWDERDQFLLQVMLICCFLIFVFSLLPLTVVLFHVPEPLIWSVISVVLAAAVISTDIWIIRRVNKLGEKVREELNHPVPLLTIALVSDVVITIALFFNALNVQSVGIYVTVLIWFIIETFVSYLRLLGFARVNIDEDSKKKQNQGG